MQFKKELSRERRHERVRKKISGSSERPRLTLYRSLRYLYAQIIDDFAKKTLVGVGTMAKGAGKKDAGNCKGAKELGKLVAKKALEKKIQKVSFDRSGYRYHGRVKAFAEGAREGGLEF